jgi:predicted  nucleic acid-binding Zn-ribbon protein
MEQNTEKNREDLKSQTPEGGETWGEDVKKHISGLNKESEKWRTKANTLESQFTELNEKLAALENESKEKREKEMAEKQEFENLYKNTKKEKSDLEQQFKSVREEAEAYKAIIESERLELLEKLPDELKSEFANSSKKQLQILLTQISKSTNTPGSENKQKTEEYDYESMSHNELMELNEKNPDMFRRVLAKYNEKKRGG